MLYLNRADSTAHGQFRNAPQLIFQKLDDAVGNAHVRGSANAGQKAAADELEVAAYLAQKFSREVSMGVANAASSGDELASQWFMAFEDSDVLDQPTRSTLVDLLDGCPSDYLMGFLAGCCLWQIEASGLSGRALGAADAACGETDWAAILDKQERVLVPLMAAQWADPAVQGWRSRYDDVDLMLAPMEELFDLACAAPTDFSAGQIYSVVRRRREEARLVALISG